MDLIETLGDPDKMRVDLARSREQLDKYPGVMTHLNACGLHLEQIATHWRRADFGDLQIGVLVQSWFITHVLNCRLCMSMAPTTPVQLAQTLALHCLEGLPQPVTLDIPDPEGTPS